MVVLEIGSLDIERLQQRALGKIEAAKLCVLQADVVQRRADALAAGALAPSDRQGLFEQCEGLLVAAAFAQQHSEVVERGGVAVVVLAMKAPSHRQRTPL